jgi:hypothetical protein
VPPRYVQACENGSWYLALTHLETWEDLYVPYRCGSWRHPGACAQKRASDDARRIREGFLRYGQPMAYLVLTFDPGDFGGGTDEAYRVIVRCWSTLYKRLVRRWGKAPYVLLVEEHKNEWPHINALLGGHVGQEVQAERWRQIRRELNPMVKAAGFGLRFWVDQRAGTAALPQYIAKYCTKAEQAPVHAPRKFRRLRATRGFLGPAKAKGTTYTGCLLTVTELQQAKIDSRRDKVRDRSVRIAEREHEARPFFRAVNLRHKELLDALARGEESGAELGITDDPSTWPSEWSGAKGRAE